MGWAPVRDWMRERWLAWAAGVLLWIAVAGAATAYSRSHGLNAWQQVVTWDEWLVAVGLLPRVLIPIFQKNEMKDPAARRVVGWVGDFSWALLVVFLLDLIARAVLGLGWEPF